MVVMGQKKDFGLKNKPHHYNNRKASIMCSGRKEDEVVTKETHLHGMGVEIECERTSRTRRGGEIL